MITIDWATFVINVPRADLTLVQTVPTEIRELDLNWFRLQLKDIEDSEDGMPFPNTHTHNTEVSLGGITYARVIEILDPYSITFEDGQYAVNLVGANSNVGDKVNLNQVSIRSNNSAGLISSPAIEYSSFNGGVMVDINSPYFGTTFPRGTEQMPVNNMDDAILIAEYRGFKRIYLKSDIILSENYQLSGYELVGSSHVNTVVIIEPQAIVDSVSIIDCDISGTMDGNTAIEHCIVTNLEFMNGHIHESELHGNITLAGGIDAYIDKSSQLTMGTTPIIDMGVSGQNLVVTNYSGIIKIVNFSGASNSVAIGLSAGYIILDSTSVKEGSVIISGIGELIDEYGNRILSGIWNGGVNIQNSLINKDTINEATQLSTYVYIDVVNGSAGTEFPIGTKRTPSNNLTDAVSIANNLGIEDLFFLSNYTFSATTYINGFGLHGSGTNQTLLTFISGSLVPNCHFHNLTATGVLSGFIGMYDGMLINLTGLGILPSSQSIMIQRTLFDGVVSVPSNYSGTVTLIDCYSNVPGAQTPTLDFGDCTGKLQVRNYTGGLQLRNMTQGNLVSVDLVSGNLKLENTVTSGTIVARGVGKMVESATGQYIPSGIWNGGVIVSNDIMSKGTISTAVWDEPLANHVIAGSTGRVLSLSEFAGVVWLDPINGVSGTTYPIGTRGYPSNNGPDALQIAIRESITEFRIDGDFTTTTNLSDYTIAGDTFLDDGLTFNNNTYSGITFKYLRLDGIATFTNCEFIGCFIENIENFSGEVIGGRISNNISVEAGKTFSGVELVVEGDNTIIDLQNAPCTVSLDVNSGIITFINAVAGCLIELNLRGGEIVLDSSCVGGDFYAEGSGTLYDNSAMTILDNHLLALEPIADYVWNKTLP